MNKILEEIAQDIRNLRDADFHVCPADSNHKTNREPGTCTCEQFDKVIDKINTLIT